MIDFFLEINNNKEEREHEKPYSKIDNYKKYICIENEVKKRHFYYYLNSFNQLEFDESFLETEHNYFFLFGKVFYRNDLNVGEKNRICVNDVFNIINNSKNFVKSIKGNFSFIIINKSDYSVSITNSPFGVIPINYSVTNGSIYISSNLTFILKELDRPKVNRTSMIQISLFDTILGTNTLVEEIKQLQYGQTIHIKENKCTEVQYYDHSKLLSNLPRTREDSLKDIIETLKENVKLLSIEDSFLFGLTGGYDCRLTLSLLPIEKYKNLTAYTYGMSGSPELKIAEDIADKFNLKYEKVILDEEFEKEYVKNADEVLFIGDGFTPFMRVNYYYAHSYLSKYARECITGMYGSEFIKPMHVTADSVSINSSVVTAFFSENVIDSFVNYFRNTRNSSTAFYQRDIFTETSLEEIVGFLKSNYLFGKEHLSKEGRIFNFYLNEGMRKFFMEIIRVDRMFVNHQLPYLDIDFVELLLSTQYAGIHNHIFNESVFKRRKGQMLYVDVFNQINPIFNNIVVDRGYKPKYLRHNLGWGFVTAGYLFGKKLRQLAKGNTTFNTKKWRGMVYKENYATLTLKSRLFNNMLIDGYNSGYYLSNEHVFGRHYSLKKWLMANDLLY